MSSPVREYNVKQDVQAARLCLSTTKYSLPLDLSINLYNLTHYFFARNRFICTINRWRFGKVITPLDTCGIVQLSGNNFARIKNKKGDPMVDVLIENYSCWAKTKGTFIWLYRYVYLYVSISRSTLCIHTFACLDVLNPSGRSIESGRTFEGEFNVIRYCPHILGHEPGETYGYGRSPVCCYR